MRSSSSMRESAGPPSSPGGSGALLKYGSGESVKSTPAGEYLTAALMDFNPAQYESDAAIADGANKLLMLVMLTAHAAGSRTIHKLERLRRLWPTLCSSISCCMFLNSFSDLIIGGIVVRILLKTRLRSPRCRLAGFGSCN